MKYDYNSNIKDVVLVTDDKERIKPRMTRFFLKLLRTNGLNPIATKHFDGNQVRQNKEFYFQRDREIFKKSFEYLTEPISIKTLLYFSRQNPELQEALKQDPLSLMEILWDEYQKRFHQPDRLHEIVEHYEVGQKFATKFPDAHILTVLFFHKVICPKLQNNGTLDYHSVGRGFYGYGSCKPIEPEIGLPGRAKILIAANAVSNLAFEKKKAFAREVFFHEYWGHVINRLDDHFNIPMNRCVMSVAPSLNAFVNKALNDNAPVFCKKCIEKIHYLPEISRKT